MNKLTHETVGVTSAVALTALYGSNISVLGNNIIMPIALTTVALGSVLPDIDLQSSTLGRKHKIISRMFTHRGFTHTLVIPLLLCGSLYSLQFYTSGAAQMLTASLTFGLLFGWVFHIFADLFNGKGVPLLWPLFPKKIHVANVVTGKKSEVIWLYLYEFAAFYLMYWRGIGLEKLICVFIAVTVLTAMLKGEVHGKLFNFAMGAGIAYMMYFTLN